MSENGFEEFDHEEMMRFGLDPSSEADRAEWVKTTPPHGTPVIHDYSRDAFEFGASVTGQQGSGTVE